MPRQPDPYVAVPRGNPLTLPAALAAVERAFGEAPAGSAFLVTIGVYPPAPEPPKPASDPLLEKGRPSRPGA